MRQQLVQQSLVVGRGLQTVLYTCRLLFEFVVDPEKAPSIGLRSSVAS